ncbi:MAG: hypothetical protein K8S99_16080 [Planctomycetes bacterium]|nr:hypothetical protein [Planctomycetota bacterium]
MAFRFEERMLHEYLVNGYTVFRGAIPDSLLGELRREGDKARALAHELHGPRAQRLGSVARYPDRINQKPFQDYRELASLRDAVHKLLGPNHKHAHEANLGILVEPLDRPWTLGWHRDAVVEVPPEAYDEGLRAKLAEVWNDLRYFNQVNCALYAESCTWFVPGSHLRQHDMPGERQSVGDETFTARIEAMGCEEAERACLEHCRNFPGAQPMHLNGGDYLIYRHLGWHNGNYIPYQPRATIHDGVFYYGPGNEWWATWHQGKLDAVARLNARKGVPVPA